MNEPILSNPAPETHTPVREVRYPYQLQGRHNANSPWDNAGYCHSLEEAISALNYRKDTYPHVEWRYVKHDSPEYGLSALGKGGFKPNSAPDLARDNALLREALEASMDHLENMAVCLKAAGYAHDYDQAQRGANYARAILAQTDRRAE